MNNTHAAHSYKEWQRWDKEFEEDGAEKSKQEEPRWHWQHLITVGSTVVILIVVGVIYFRVIHDF